MDGIQTCGQLLEGGLTRRNIDRLTRVDGLTGIRQLQSVSDCRLDRIHAALAVAPADAVLSGWAAAVVHGVPSDFLDGTWDGRPQALGLPEGVHVGGGGQVGGARGRCCSRLAHDGRTDQLTEPVQSEGMN